MVEFFFMKFVLYYFDFIYIDIKTVKTFSQLFSENKQTHMKLEEFDKSFFFKLKTLFEFFRKIYVTNVDNKTYIKYNNIKRISQALINDQNNLWESFFLFVHFMGSMIHYFLNLQINVSLEHLVKCSLQLWFKI